MILSIPAAAGEVVDKLTILEIKLDRIADTAKRANIAEEHRLLAAAWAEAVPDPSPIAALRTELRAVNETLWQIEDDIREQERRADFGPRFIELARAVYHQNDRRADIKRAINLCLGSRIVEEKSYAPY